MPSPLESLVASGTKLWLDSIEPKLILRNIGLGATGATSNPIIISDILKSGHYDDEIRVLALQNYDPEEIAWLLTDSLVTQAERFFSPVFDKTNGDDGYVSFELDPLLEDVATKLTHKEKIEHYVALGKHWADDHQNRLIKVPATPAGIDSLEELAAAGVNLNVTLIFTERQYEAARDAIWRGAKRRPNLAYFKSVYSIFVSRIDVYTDKNVKDLSPAAQGQVGIVNAKRVWRKNTEFWSRNQTPLKQEIVFASTGTKKASDAKWKYVEAFAGSDIETNPPETNDAADKSGMTFKRNIDQLPAPEVLAEIDKKVNWENLEKDLMDEGLAKFSQPQRDLIKMITSKLGI